MPAVVVNGETLTLAERATIADAVASAGVGQESRGVAVAVEGEVVPRRDWAAVELADGAHVEVLHAVQGG